MLDVERYVERIDYRGSLDVRASTLDAICRAHATHVPFENLDIHLGLPIDLTADRLFEKIVIRRRGGYCFEQNSLLLEVLTILGFRARPIAARVRFGSPDAPPRPRTHMALLVDVGARTFLADVGFGVYNLLGALPFEPGEEREVQGDRFRIREIAWDGRALGAPPSFDVEAFAETPDGARAWSPLYRVSLEEQQRIDFEMASWFTSTHPSSFFVKQKIVSNVTLTEDGTPLRRMLVDRELREGRSTTTIPTDAGDAAYRAVLREKLGLELPADAALRW